ncbi:MAG: molybdenum cofactor biosynthesis protein MoaE [Flavobacteriales bacterium]
MNQERIHIGRHRLDTEGLQNLYSQPQDGGIVAFTGTVRNATSEREVLHLDFEAYEPMAVHTLEQLRGKTIRKFGVRDVVIHHRLGRVLPGHAAVVVVVFSAHRKEAFEACAYVMDRLKKEVPIWKKEAFVDGEVWVSAHP